MRKKEGKNGLGAFDRGVYQNETCIQSQMRINKKIMNFEGAKNNF